MAESDELRITVSLIDNASAPLAAMRREVQGLGQDAGKQMAPLKGAFEGASKAIKEVTGGHTAAQFEIFKRSQIDMARIIKTGTDVTLGGEKALLGFIGKFGVAGAAVASLGTLAAAAAASNKQWADSMVELKTRAELLGTDPANLKEFEKQAREAHVPLEDLQKVLRTLPQISIGLRDESSPMFQQMLDIAGPKFMGSVLEFRRQFQAASGDAEKIGVLQRSIAAFGESAAEDARKEEEAQVRAGVKRQVNEDNINKARLEGQHIAERVFGEPETILMLPRQMKEASEAVKQSMKESLDAAEKVNAEFLKTEETVKRMWNEFEAGISGPVLEGVGKVRSVLEAAEDAWIRTHGTPAQQAAQEERRQRELDKKHAERGIETFAHIPVFVNRPAPPVGGRETSTEYRKPLTVEGIRDALEGEHRFTAPFQPSPFDYLYHGYTAPAPTPLPGMYRAAPPEEGAATFLERSGSFFAPSGGSTFGERFSGEGQEQRQPEEPTPLWQRLLDRVRGGGEGGHGPAMIGPTLARAALSGALGDDHQKATDQNTDQLRTLNEKLSELTQKLQPQGAPLEPFPQPGQRRAELELPPLPAVPPFRHAGIPPVGQGGEGARDIHSVSILRRQVGQPQFGDAEQRADRFRDSDEVPVLRRDERSELDRRVLDYAKILQVEGTGTLTANISAPAGTRVGLEAGGLFKKTQLNRQTQMAFASTGPPNPGYSPTLEDFPL